MSVSYVRKQNFLRDIMRSEGLNTRLNAAQGVRFLRKEELGYTCKNKLHVSYIIECLL